MFKHTIALLMSALAAAQSASDPLVRLAAQDDSLAEQIIHAQQVRERSTARMSLSGSAVASVYHGQAFAEPLIVDTDIAIADGRLHVQLRGADLDHGGLPDEMSQLRGRTLDRLYLPSGMVEAFDHEAAELTYTEFHFKDVRSFYSLLTPSELLWSFSSSLRSHTMQHRGLVIDEVRGSRPDREVVCSATSASGIQEFRYICVESWGWLPRRVESWSHDRILPELCLSVDVHTVHHTRLGVVPATGSLDEQRNGKTYHSVALEFSAPTFVGVTTPTTLNTTDSAQAGAVTADPLYSPESFVAQNRLWDRGELIDELFTMAGTKPVGGLAGEQNLLVARGPWLFCGAVLATLLAALLASRRRRIATACAVTAVLLAMLPVAGTVSLGTDSNPTGDNHASAEVLAASLPSMRSRSLCGIDTLYGMAHCAGHESLSYLRLLRLVRPGHEGTDLGNLQRVAEATGMPLQLVDAADYTTPPVPSIIHLSGQHFVLLTGHRDADLEVFDPGVGVVRRSWASLRQEMSRPMLTLERNTL